MDVILNNFGKIFWSAAALGTAILAIKNLPQIKKFISEVRVELSKVSWSNRQQLLSATRAVIAITAIMAIYIGIVDLGLSRFLTLLIQ